jgi:hypothetical protein
MIPAGVLVDRDLGDEATLMAYCEAGCHDVALFDQPGHVHRQAFVIEGVEAMHQQMGLGGVVIIAECEDCQERISERNAERAYEDYHGGSGPQTAEERHQAAYEQKRALR